MIPLDETKKRLAQSTRTMCGIFATLSPDKCCYRKVFSGISKLTNRGYDSCGIQILRSGQPRSTVQKFAVRQNDDGAALDPVEQMKQSLLSLSTDSSEADSCGYGVSVAHTRWASHGAVTIENCHPHLDSLDGAFSIVHNGVVTNTLALKQKILGVVPNYKFRGETDTEVVVALLSVEFLLITARASGTTREHVFNALLATLEQLEGSWALVVTCKLYPDSIWAAVHGSPLLLGCSADFSELSLASEKAAFSAQTKRFFRLPEKSAWQATGIASSENQGDRGVIYISTPKDTERDDPTPVFSSSLARDVFETLGENTQTVLQTSSCCTNTDESPSAAAGGGGGNWYDLNEPPSRFESWTEKEIWDQAESSLAASLGGRLCPRTGRVKLGGLEIFRDGLGKVKHLVMVGCGSSMHACMAAMPVFRRLRVFDTVQVFDASEFRLEDDLPNLIREDGVVEMIAVLIASQSGETKDCQVVLKQLRDVGSSRLFISVGVVNVVGSWIAEQCDCGVYLNAGREVGVASTKSFTSQFFVLILVAFWFKQNRGCPAVSGSRDFGHPCPQLGEIADLVAFNIGGLQGAGRAIADFASEKSCQSALCLGSRTGLAIAREACLKIKELAYVHAEAFSLGALKHGPLALVSEGTVCIVISDGVRDSTTVSEIRARGGPVVLLQPSVHSPKIGWTRASEGVLTVEIPVFQSDLQNEGANACFATLCAILSQFVAVELAKTRGHPIDRPRNLAKVVTVM